MELIIIGFLGGAVAFGLLQRAWKKRSRKTTESAPLVLASIEQMRSLGELSVFKVLTKEIVTQTDHAWGELGSRYLSWVLSKKKMSLIFEFVIDFRYNLRSAQFTIEERENNAFKITLPPCIPEVSIRNIRFYDEQQARLMPWLLPDLLNGIFAGKFSVEDKNRLVEAAKGYARKQALELVAAVDTDVQQSAVTTLESIAGAFGAEKVSFEFSTSEDSDIRVEMQNKVINGQEEVAG